MRLYGISRANNARVGGALLPAICGNRRSYFVHIVAPIRTFPIKNPKMIEKRKIALTKDEFYEAIRLYIHENRNIVMPMDKSEVVMDTDDDQKLTFEWEIK